jgi:catechol 2,3-dioxygenase-like lactoylglutathione lyase family enzyme
MIIDHIGVSCTNYEATKTFYQKALAPLGITLIMEFGKAAGFGIKGKPDFWLSEGKASFQNEAHAKNISPIHVCFAAPDRATVDAFHKAALEAGGKDFGAPGLRPEYHANYYGAFILDPDGHNIEAAYHGPGPA